MTGTEGQTAAPESGPKLIHAPFTDPQVEQLNRYQQSGRMHPFTCGGEHEQHVTLTATTAGWVCPEGCGYTQDWAHAFMADQEALDRLLRSPFEQ